MNQHTHKSASWGQWILNKCGLTDLPICVNCWYCNQTVYLLPGGKQTKHYWYCNLCENTNITNDNGDVLDPPLYTALSKQQKEKRKQYSQINNHTNNTNQSILCDECQVNQQIIYDMMNRYNSEEKEMEDDNEDLSRAYQYKQYLDNRYPLCDTCKHKVTERIRQQYVSLGLKNIESRGKQNGQNDNNNMVIPKKNLTKNQYKFYGLIWIITHLVVLHLCLYAIIYPPLPSSTFFNGSFNSSSSPSSSDTTTPTTTSDTTVVKLGRSHQDFNNNNNNNSNNDNNNNSNNHSFINIVSNNISYTYSILLDYLILYLYQENKIQFIINLCNQSVQYIIDQVSFTSQFLWKTNICLLLQLISYGFNITIQMETNNNNNNNNNNNSGDNQCQHWRLNTVLFSYIAFYLYSSYFMDWHIRASKWIMEKSTIKHWFIYKVIQRGLFISRFWLLWKLYYGPIDKNTLFTFGTGYILLLSFSTLYVKVIQPDYWFSKTIGKLNTMKQDNNSNTNNNARVSPSSISSSSSTYHHHQQQPRHNNIFNIILSFFNNIISWIYYSTIGTFISLFSKSAFKTNNNINDTNDHSTYDRFIQQDREVEGLAADLNRISV